MRLSTEVIAQLVVDYQAGVSSPELQKRYGLSKGTVLRLLNEAGVEMRRRGLSAEQLGEVVRLYESGMTIREVARDLGVPKTTVQNALERTRTVKRPAARCKITQ